MRMSVRTCLRRFAHCLFPGAGKNFLAERNLFMKKNSTARFRIYPSIGVARLGNGPAEKQHVIFSPEIPWGNLFETDNHYLMPDGKIKKQAQRFYIFECDKRGRPVRQIDPADYDIRWSAEVANKKPFWYDFNNSLDLSIVSRNRNVSPDFAKNKIGPGIGSAQRNPNVLDMGERVPDGYNYRKELVNNPAAVTVDQKNTRQSIPGQFPNAGGVGQGLLAASLGTAPAQVDLGTLEYDEGVLIFYAADGVSASLNASDLNTDFADNSNWYDDICDGRITATIKSRSTGVTHRLDDAESAAWVVTAPPDYAPQIQPISTLYDIISGAGTNKYEPEFSLVFPMLYRLYRMQWVNLGDFLAPSFREVIDKLTQDGKLNFLFQKHPKGEADAVRAKIFDLFRNPAYPYLNEPIIPSSSTTGIEDRGVGTAELKLPYYPGDGINYPGSPAQWFAIPPLLYEQFRKWKEGEFKPMRLPATDMDAIGEVFRKKYLDAAKDERKRPLLMTRAVLETLYGGGFHPGVELTWPMRHDLIYAENLEVYEDVAENFSLFGLREIRINAATPAEQRKIYYNDFGLQMDSEDIRESMDPNHKNHWLWKITPGDLTKWMGIPWQSDAGSCQAVFVDKQYPIPAWWAANLPVHVLPQENYRKLLDPGILDDTKKNIFANREDWLHTANTGFIGYHAEAGYLNGLINMVYEWNKIGMVTGRALDLSIDGIPKRVYVAYHSKE